MVTNRLSADVVLVDLSTFSIVGSHLLTTEEHPMIALDFSSYYGGRLYVVFRGPEPLTALKVPVKISLSILIRKLVLKRNKLNLVLSILFTHFHGILSTWECFVYNLEHSCGSVFKVRGETNKLVKEYLIS